jgi:hypothetical protein
MWLKMYIGKIFVDRYKLDYTEMITSTEIQQYQERIACELYQKHIGNIRQSDPKPEFFVEGVKSKMNDIDFNEITWDEIHEIYGFKTNKIAV